MHIISKVLIGFIAFLHSYIMIFEMFFWESRGPKVFSSFPAELFAPTKAIAANQGLYNGFLSAGLIWALFFISNIKWQKNVAIFFLTCVAVAGVYGAFTVAPKIVFVQTVPAVLAITSLYLFKK